MPQVPTLPKEVMRRAFEELGALYVIYWARDGERYRVAADYEVPSSVNARLRRRSDGASIISNARQRTFPVDGTGPVAMAVKSGEEQVVCFGLEDGSEVASKLPVLGLFDLIDADRSGAIEIAELRDYLGDELRDELGGERYLGCISRLFAKLDVDGDGYISRDELALAQAAMDFGIKTIHFVPFDGGVIEYGVAGEAELTDVTMEATLKMQCEASGAAYAMYWKDTRGVAVVAGSYINPAHTAQMLINGKKLSFAEASLSIVKNWEGAPLPCAVGKVLATRKPIFIKDAKSSSELAPQRVLAAREYGIDSICMVPVLGGVVEYGTSDGACTATWERFEDAGSDGLPKAELNKAFRGGATYAIFWKPDYRNGKYAMAANFETSAQSLSQQACPKTTYVAECATFAPSIGGSGPIGIAGSSGVSVTVDTDRLTDRSLKRSSLFQDWGIGSITCVPCNGGVLEYGTVTADKRGSTIGPEFQESQRPYRRTVFTGPDWVKHRSAKRFEKAMGSTLTSGILRARYKEVAFVGAVATFVVCWNTLAAGYVDFDNLPHGALVQHLPLLNIPTTVFTLTSPSLGLLLVFRTNACYARWDNSRRVWGDIINKCRSLVRQANTFMHDDYPGHGKFQDWRRRTAAETSAFTRCLRTFLRGPEDDQNLRVELKTLGFTPVEVDGYMASSNRQCYALQQLGTTIGKASLDGRDRSRMDTTLSELCDDVGACERIFKTPIPIIYTRHTSRFVGFWLALLPLAIYSVDPSWNHLLTIPSVMAITFFLLGIEELGLQIEEPFSILPMEAFCDASIGAVLYDMAIHKAESFAEYLARREASAAN